MVNIEHPLRLAYVSVEIDNWDDWSKNRAWRSGKTWTGKRTHYTPEPAKIARATLARLLRASLSKGLEVHERVSVAHNRLSVGIHVAKGRRTQDAHNCIPTVLDAVQDATGLDDQWYELTWLTWGLRPLAPSISVMITQPNMWDGILCGNCGEVLPFERFGKRKDGPFGRAQVCRECLRK
jgi:hypothetical protein